jgi:hypothetical protein
MVPGKKSFSCSLELCERARNELCARATNYARRPKLATTRSLPRVCVHRFLKIGEPIKNATDRHLTRCVVRREYVS